MKQDTGGDPVEPGDGTESSSPCLLQEALLRLQFPLFSASTPEIFPQLLLNKGGTAEGKLPGQAGVCPLQLSWPCLPLLLLSHGAQGVWLGSSSPSAEASGRRAFLSVRG